jgi:hypothetical protein
MPEEDNKDRGCGSPTILMSEGVGKSFLTAVLLTGCVKRAEIAVLEGIQSLRSGGRGGFADKRRRGRCTATVRADERRR